MIEGLKTLKTKVAIKILVLNLLGIIENDKFFELVLEDQPKGSLMETL